MKKDSNSNISLTQGDKEKFVFSMLGEFFSMKKGSNLDNSKVNWWHWECELELILMHSHSNMIKPDW